eukprot:g1068.t1
MGDPSNAVRQAALNTLSRAVEPGSKAAIEAVCRCLKDCEGEVRRIALKTLSCISEKGNTQVINLLCDNLAGGDLFTKATAIKGLTKVAGIGHAQCLSTMLELIGHRKVATRTFAMESLSQVAARGDGRAVEAARGSLLDPDAQVRQAAAVSLGQLATPGDEDVIQELLQFCMALLLICTLTNFIKFHMKLVLENYTTIENLEREEGAKSKFDIGRRRTGRNCEGCIDKNWEQVFGQNPWMWWIPLHTQASRPIGDGVRWRVHYTRVIDEDEELPADEEGMSQASRLLNQGNAGSANRSSGR